MIENNSLYYISDADIPGKRAHTIQQLQMCESFTRTGLDVTYIHTRPAGKGKNPDWDYISDYYGVEESFNIKTFRTLQTNLSQFPKIETMSMALPIATYIGKNVLLSSILDSDIIYSRNYYPTYFLAELKTLFPTGEFPPVVFEYHDTMDKRFQNRFFENIDAVVAITHVLKEFATSEFDIDASRIFVAPDGVDPKKYRQWTKPEARKELNLPDDEEIVVYTGHLYPGKGAAVLAQAAGQIDAQVYIVGGYREDIERVQSSVPDYPNLHFTGFVNPSEIPPYQVAADVLVAPYTHEARRFVSPLKLFEYMATENPIVATDLQALREVLTDEYNALLAEPGNKNSLATLVNELLTNEALATTLSRNASEDLKNYHWDQRAANIIKFVDCIQDGR